MPNNVTRTLYTPHQQSRQLSKLVTIAFSVLKIQNVIVSNMVSLKVMQPVTNRGMQSYHNLLSLRGHVTLICCTLEVTKTHKTLVNKKPRIYKISLVRPTNLHGLYRQLQSRVAQEVGCGARARAHVFLLLPISYWSLGNSLIFTLLTVPCLSNDDKNSNHIGGQL